MSRPPTKVRRLDEHWLRSLGFTLGLIALVAAAIGADWAPTLSVIAICGIGFGFFYLLFPGGAHFGMTVANFLAVYACLFVFFHDANFPNAPEGVSAIALSLPVLGFLASCFLNRRRVFALIHARRLRELQRLPRVMRWLLTTMLVGAASFAVPRLQLTGPSQGVVLLGAMTVITGFVIGAVRDVVLMMIDIAMIFESVTARLDRLVLPLMAFLTFYALLVVVFACLYRIADLTTPLPQFTLHAEPARISFVDALYYSVATITTLGFGDFAPASLLVRALTGLEVVSGIIMLLFGFSEIMRNAGPDVDRRTRPRAEPPAGD